MVSGRHSSWLGVEPSLSRVISIQTAASHGLDYSATSACLPDKMSLRSKVAAFVARSFAATTLHRTTSNCKKNLGKVDRAEKNEKKTFETKKVEVNDEDARQEEAEKHRVLAH